MVGSVTHPAETVEDAIHARLNQLHGQNGQDLIKDSDPHRRHDGRQGEQADEADDAGEMIKACCGHYPQLWSERWLPMYKSPEGTAVLNRCGLH